MNELEKASKKKFDLKEYRRHWFSLVILFVWLLVEVSEPVLMRIWWEGFEYSKNFRNILHIFVIMAGFVMFGKPVFEDALLIYARYKRYMRGDLRKEKEENND